jgi:hypothetical protein
MIWPFKKKQDVQWPPERSDAWPVFVDSMRATMCWMHPDRTRRVFLIERTDGTFSKWSEYFSDHEFEMCWIQEDAGGSFYDSEETAIREIHSTYLWTQDVDPEKQAAEQSASGDAADRAPEP